MFRDLFFVLISFMFFSSAFSYIEDEEDRGQYFLSYIEEEAHMGHGVGLFLPPPKSFWEMRDQILPSQLILTQNSRPVFDESLIISKSENIVGSWCKDSKDMGEVVIAKKAKYLFDWASDSEWGGAYTLNPEMEHYIQSLFETISYSWGHHLDPLDLFHGHIVVHASDLFIVFHAKEYPLSLAGNAVYIMTNHFTDIPIFDDDHPHFFQRNIVYSLKHNALFLITDPKLIDGEGYVFRESIIPGVILGSFNYLPTYGLYQRPFVALKSFKNNLRMYRLEQLLANLSDLSYKHIVEACLCYRKIQGQWPLSSIEEWNREHQGKQQISFTDLNRIYTHAGSLEK